MATPSTVAPFQQLLNTNKSGIAFPQTPEQWSAERDRLLRSNRSKEEVDQVMGRFYPSSGQNAGEQEFFKTLSGTAKQRQWLDSPEGIKYQLELAREDAREKAKQTLMWGTLAKLPEQIANAANPFGGPVGSAIAYQGMSNIPSIYSNTLASFPQIQVPGYNQQLQRYFS